MLAFSVVCLYFCASVWLYFAEKSVVRDGRGTGESQEVGRRLRANMVSDVYVKNGF